MTEEGLATVTYFDVAEANSESLGCFVLCVYVCVCKCASTGICDRGKFEITVNRYFGSSMYILIYMHTYIPNGKASERHIDVCMHIYTHTYTCMCMHTYIHTYQMEKHLSAIMM